MTRQDRSGDPPVRLGAAAAVIGRGLVAGLVGTGAMTLSTTVEMRLRGRERSTAPARAAGRVLGVAPVDHRGERRFNRIVHWAYGTAWGASRALFTTIGVPAVAADLGHLGTVWGAEQVVLPATRTDAPPTQGPPTAAAIDLAHHAVYAVTTGLTFRWLERR